MRKAFAFVAGLSILVGIACGSSGKDEGQTSAPPVTTATPELRIATFDAAEPGWGDAPVSVHFTWAIESTTGRPLTCLLDVDGDGSIDQRIEGCRANTLREPIDGLPAHSYANPGEHKPKLVVTDGVNTVDATQEIFANKITFGKNTVFPEKMAGFVNAEAVPNTSVVLTFASEAQVPNVKVGDILWGTSGTGYLIKATEVTKSGATVSIKGVQGQVGEAIENGFLGARNVRPSYDGVKCLDETCQGSTIEKLTADPPLPPTLSPQSLGVRRDAFESGGGNFGVKIGLPNGGNPFEHSIFMGLKIDKFILEIGFFTVNRFVVDVTPNFNYEIAFKGTIAEKKISLGTFTLGTFPIGPVVITPIVFPYISVGANLKFGGSVGYDFPLKMQYTKVRGVETSFDAQRRGSADEAPEPFGAGAAFEAEGKLGFPVTAAIFGIGGPYFGPVLGLTGEFKVSPEFTQDPCKKKIEVCIGAKASFTGEFGFGCPWIEDINVKAELGFTELELFKRCSGKEETDPEKCPDAGSDGDAGGDAEAGPPPGCVPSGTVSGPPTGSPSGSAHCGGSEVFWSGSNLGTMSCWTIGGKTFSSVPGSGQRAILPMDIAPGSYTLSVQAPGGTITAPFTITAGEAPNATAISPASGPPGTAMTVTGTGLTGFTNVTVSGTGGPPSASVPVTSQNGTSLTFAIPNLAPGSYKVDFYKADCGFDSINFTITAPASTLSACWQAAAGNYTAVDNGCGLSNYAVTVNPNDIVATPFGSNGAVTFSAPGGSDLAAAGLFIFGQPNHTCTMTCNGNQVMSACTNTGGGSCQQIFTR